MKLLVCLKQVPELSAGVPDETLGLIFPENAPQAVSALDTCALEAAARIQDEDPACSITLLSLDGETALRDGLSAVGEEALLLRDPFFAGADPVAKGVSLAAAVREWERRRGGPFDLILCGQQSSDLGSGLTGPVLAGCLGRPAVSGVLEAAVEGDRFRFRRQIQDGVQAVTAPRPCVALVTWTGYSLRFPNILRRMEAVDRMLPVLDASVLSEKDRAAVSRRSDRMHPVKTFAPRCKTDVVQIRASTGEGAALGLLAMLERAKVL